jgi:hypothetical protein
VILDRPRLLDMVTGDAVSLPRSDSLTRQVLAVHDDVSYRQGSLAGSHA